MIAEDLMIGDWVSISGTPMRIGSLLRKLAAFFDEKGEILYHGYNMIEPIPLTAEILEKNGFRPLYDDLSAYKLFWSDEKKESYWSITIDLTHPLASRIENNIFNSINRRWEMRGSVNFVHEMQHIMRQFEIEKEIIV